jgi:hypothetical protein
MATHLYYLLLLISLADAERCFKPIWPLVYNATNYNDIGFNAIKMDKVDNFYLGGWVGSKSQKYSSLSLVDKYQTHHSTLVIDNFEQIKLLYLTESGLIHSITEQPFGIVTFSVYLKKLQVSSSFEFKDFNNFEAQDITLFDDNFVVLAS